MFDVHTQASSPIHLLFFLLTVVPKMPHTLFLNATGITVPGTYSEVLHFSFLVRLVLLTPVEVYRLLTTISTKTYNH